MLEPSSNAKYLWICCSDDSCVESALPCEVRDESLIHTNLGNQMAAADLNSISTLEMAIESYEVEQIIICGHYRCKIIETAVKGGTGDFVGHWLSPLKKISQRYKGWLDGLPNKLDAIAELNAIHQAVNVAKNPVLRSAWNVKPRISLAALVIDPATGHFRDLNFRASAETEVTIEFDRAIEAFKRRWEID